MEAVNGVSEGDKGGPPPPSPLTGCYLLIVIGEPHSSEHKDIILQRVAKGLLSWDLTDCLVDLEKELAIITEQALEGEEARYGERLIQFASENLVTEILIHPVVSTLAQCVRNLLSSFTRHRHIIHAGYTFAANGSWALQDGTFSSADFSEAFQEVEVQRVIRAYENGISLDLHCSPEGDWMRLPKESFARSCKVRVNPNDVLTAGSPSITSFINYISPFLVVTELEALLESSDVVGNIRFSRPTLYVFPGGQGDAALFGINGFNMLLDGGFSRKACFWDFVRHLDRLDAVLMTRLNNSNVNGISAVLKRKNQNAVYPQIGHFFCNIHERKAILSPDGDKDKDPLLINLLEEGQEIISNLRHLNLNPQVCYRDSEPINLYHKVGHGTLDMYVLSPAKDSKEVREFIQKWNNSDQKLFANQKSPREFTFPIQNLISICALLVWQPANPNDTITRILFPGSSPQRKIFEGLDRLKQLEFIKHPVCSEKSLAPQSITKSKPIKDNILDKVTAPKEKIPIEKKEKPIIPTENKLIENGDINGVIEKSVQEKIVKKSDSTESEKSTKTKNDAAKIIENTDKPDKPKAKLRPETTKTSKLRNDSQQRRKPAEKKASPTTPKKTVDNKVNGDAKKSTKPSPTGTPAKSAKDANNRKVIESKINKTAPKKEPSPKPTETKPPKIERKPISRRPKGTMKAPVSPMKKVNGVQKPDSISRKGKLDKEGTTDSSTVSTPSADQDSILKKDISKLTPDELQQLKEKELADLKEEQEAVKEIEAVFRKSETQPDDSSNLRKIKDISIDDKVETEEYIIIEKEVVEHDSLEDKDAKEDETQKLARDSEESEKQRKLSSEQSKEEGQPQLKELSQEDQIEVKEEVENIVNEAEKIVKTKDEIQETTVEKEDKKEEEVPVESQPDEKCSANVESGATTTAPTLPEDERIPLDEIKEDNNGQAIEEKHVKEETKEKEIPLIQLPPKTFENIGKIPSVVGIRLDKQSHIRDIVKTPDEVADLPVHEEVDFNDYQQELKPSDAVETTTDPEKKSAEVTPDDATKTKKETNDNDKNVDEIETVISNEKVENKIVSPVKVLEAEDVLGKKELTKSPDEEKEEDEHELEEADDKHVPEEAPKELNELEKSDIKIEEATKEKEIEQQKITSEEKITTEEMGVSKAEVLEKAEVETIEKKESDIKLKTEINKEHVDEIKEEPKVEEDNKEVESDKICDKEQSSTKEEKSDASKEIVEGKIESDNKLSDTKTEELDKLKEDKEVTKEKITTEEVETPEVQVSDEQEKKDDEKETKEDVVKDKEVTPEQDNKQTEELIKSIKEDVSIISKIDDKMQELKSTKSESNIVTVDRKTETPEHAEPVVITDSAPDSPEIEDKLHADFKEKLELGRKSPKEREEDVIKIVAKVAEVLKSDAPLEEFEGKIPFTPFPPYTATFTTELRETHITTCDSPLVENKPIKTDDIPTIPEEPCSPKSLLEEETKYDLPEVTEKEKQEETVLSPDQKRSSLLKESQELMMATSKMISEIKQSKTDESLSKDDKDGDPGTVHRMLVTASSEDGGEEIEICPPGTITFSRSSESSGRSSPDLQSQKLSQKSSIVDTLSDSITTVKHVKEGQSEKDSGIDDIKSENEQDKVKATESIASSGKSTPDLTKREEKTELEKLDSKTPVDLSGKSTPDIKESSKEVDNKTPVELSGKSTPEIVSKPVDDEKTKSKTKEEVEPELKEAEVSKTPEEDTKLSESEIKDTADIKMKDEIKSSGTSTPELQTKDKLDEHVKLPESESKEPKESSKLSGKVTPDLSKAVEQDTPTLQPELKDETVKDSEPESQDISKVEEKSASEQTAEKVKEQFVKESETEVEEVKAEQLPDKKLELKTIEETSKLSGKSTPDPELKELQEHSKLSGKATPEADLKMSEEPENLTSVPQEIEETVTKLEEPSKLSGKSTPEPELKKTEESSKLSGKSTPEPELKKPEETSKLSGKSTPEPEMQKIEESSILSGKSTPEPELIKPKESSKLSGKSTPEPELKKQEETSKLSGKSTPEPEIKKTPESSKLSEKSTPEPELKKPEESSKLSGKSTPEPELKKTEESFKLSGKSTPEPELKKTEESSKLSGKSTPEPELKKPDESAKLSGKSTPEPELKKLEESSKISGKSTPEPELKKLEESLKLSGKTTPEPELKKTEESLKSSGKLTPEPELKETKESEKSTPESELKKPEESSKLSGKSTPEPDMKQPEESTKLSGKSTPEPELKKLDDFSKVPEKSTSEPQVTEETEKIFDSMKKNEEFEKVSDSKLEENKSEEAGIKLNEGSDKNLEEPIKLSGKSTPDLETKNEVSNKLEEVSKVSGKSTPELESKIENTNKMEETSELTGKSTPELKKEVEEFEKSSSAQEVKQLKEESKLSGKSTPEPEMKNDISNKLEEVSVPDVNKIDAGQLEEPSKLSGKSTPEPEMKEESKLNEVSKIPEKSTPDPEPIKKLSEPEIEEEPQLKDKDTKLSEPEITKTSTRSLEEEKSIPETPHTDSLANLEKQIVTDKLDGKTYSVGSNSSGKSTPDVGLHDKEMDEISEKIEKGISEIKLDSKLSSEISDDIKSLSGKSTPLLDSKTPNLSGKTTPALSGKSTPAPELSGTASPVPPITDETVKESIEHLHETFDEVSQMIKTVVSDASEKTEKAMEEVLGKSASGLEEAYDTMNEISKNVTFDKCEKLEKGTDDLKETFDAVSDMSKSIMFDKCDKVVDKSVTDLGIMTNGIIDSLNKDLENASDFLEKSSNDLRETFDNVSDMSKSVVFEKCDSPKERSLDHLCNEISKDQPNGDVIHDKKHSEESSQIIEPAAISVNVTDSTSSKPEIVDEKVVSTLDVQQSDTKKLSISDVEISFGEKTAIDEKEICNSMIEAERTLYSLGTSNDATVSDIESCDKDKDLAQKNITVAKDNKLVSEDKEKTAEEEKEDSSSRKNSVIESVSKPGSSKQDLTKLSTEDLNLSGKSTPDIADIEKQKESSATSQEKHIADIPITTAPTTVPAISTQDTSKPVTVPTTDAKKTNQESSMISTIKDVDVRSSTPGSDDYDISSGQVSRAPNVLESERIESDDEDLPGSPMSITSQVAHSRSSSHYDFDDDQKPPQASAKIDPMNMSLYGALPDEPDIPATYLYEITKAKFSAGTTEDYGNANIDLHLDQLNQNGHSTTKSTTTKKEEDVMTASFIGELPSVSEKKDPIESWGKPLGLPSPAPPQDNKGTPKKEKKLSATVSAKNKLNDDRKRSESPSKYRNNKKINPVYVDLTYVPHHGNANYSYIDFFKRVRARYYVFSGIEPSREVYNALLEAKQTWEDRDLEVTIIPTYDTDILGYWVAENEELLSKFKIDLSPSASRCTINLQDHETSCSAYRLEF